MSVAKYATQQVLELACAAQRINKGYIKSGAEAVFDSEGKYVYQNQPNKVLMLVTVDPKFWTGAPADQPFPLKITAEDTEQANAIRSHYKKLMFAAIEGTNEFLTTVNSLLSSTDIATNQFGYIACLPSVHAKDAMHTKVKKVARSVDEGFLGEVGSNLTDMDCEILEVIKSKNFEGYNVCAIIDNKMVSWLSRGPLTVGPCVVVKAKVKALGKHWKHGNDETRLNYVKAAQ